MWCIPVSIFDFVKISTSSTLALFYPSVSEHCFQDYVLAFYVIYNDKTILQFHYNSINVRTRAWAWLRTWPWSILWMRLGSCLDRTERIIGGSPSPGASIGFLPSSRIIKRVELSIYDEHHQQTPFVQSFHCHCLLIWKKWPVNIFSAVF